MADPKTGLAYSICHIVPAIMSRQLITQWGFSFTNRSTDPLTGSKLVLASNGVNYISNSLPDQVRRIALAEEQLKVELLGAIMGQESIGDFSISVFAQSLHTIDINIAVNGEHYHTEFVAPAYCGNIYTSMMGSGQQSIKNLSTDLSVMLDELYGTSTNTTSY